MSCSDDVSKRPFADTIVLLALVLAIMAAPALADVSVPADVVDIFDIQYTTDASGDSPLVGQVVMTSGVVNSITADGFTIADSIGAWHSVFVYTIRYGPVVGDSVEVTGKVQEYYGMTEISDVTNVRHLSSGHPVIAFDVDPSLAGQEANESALIRIGPVTVTQLLSYGEWVVGGALVVDDVNDYNYFPKVGDQLDSLAGVLFYSFGTFKLEPRNTSDIKGPPIPHYALGGDVVTMNAARDVLPDHYVEISGDRIVAVHPTMPVGLPVVETGGLIFPGLIDAHNHAAYNTLGVIPFGTLFGDRYEWQSGPLYSEFREQYDGIRDYGGPGALTVFIHKLAEVRALCAGTTTIQGVNCNGHEYDSFAHQGMGINNAERFPSRILSSTFPLSQSVAYWQARAGEYWDRFVIHLAEGVNTAAMDEFSAWQALGMLDARTTIIHGVAMGASQWTSLAEAGGHLVWSPRSNVSLYGATADIPGALSAGVGVSLAPDWSESGSPDLLSEMKFARALSDSLWGGVLTAQLLAEMVTRNAADALGAGERIGQIGAGCQADLTVVPGSPSAPYEDLLEADAGDVALTVVSGRPMYGDPALMSEFTFLADTEDITVEGVTKRLATRIVSHAIPDAEVSTAEVITTLETAYTASYPPICCFLAIEPHSCARAPVAHGDTYEVTWSQTLDINAPGVLGNDFDGDGDSLTATVIDAPSHGVLTLAPDGGFVYEHAGTFADSDTFEYAASDGILNSKPSAVIIAITSPTAVGDTNTPPAHGRLQVHPNPFNSATTIAFTLRERTRVALTIYDVKGRLVNTLVDGIVEQGYQERPWDGRDSDGNPVSSGVYFYRLTAGEKTLTRKMVLLK